MLTLRRCGQLHVRTLAKYFTSQPAVQEEYTEKPQYPEILDLSFRAKKKREATDWQTEIRHVPTVEEKMIKINMPRYYGYKVVKLDDQIQPYNCLPALQHYTRTVFEDWKTPATVAAADQQSQQKMDAFVQLISAEVQEAIEYAHDYFIHQHNDAKRLDPKEQERIIAQLIVEQINRTLINALSADCPHLHEVEIDYNPRHEAFWFVGGIDPPKITVKAKKGREWQKEMANDLVDRLMQYVGSPYLAVRHRDQLPAWKKEHEVENAELAESIPRYKYDPRTLGYMSGYCHGTNIPGYWPGSSSGFGTILFQSRMPVHNRSSTLSEEDLREALHAQAIQSSYAWLLAQANYNGFNTFDDLTYPMNTQTIVTNGRDFSFYEYQLNTLLVHAEHVFENPRVNFCRGTAELKLFEEIDANGKCCGFNDQVLRYLIQFYTNAPAAVQRTKAERQPFLQPDLERVANYADAEQRMFLERMFKHMVTNRPRHLALPEIYLWEKIYKIDNKTRQLEPRRRYFELDINPWKRTLDQRHREYIPKVLRPEGPKSRKKWKPMYYP